MSLESFVQGFAECALWLGKHYESEAEFEDGDGTSLDSMYGIADLPDNIWKEMRDDCESFYDNHSHLWADESDYDDEQAGHDFCLSRNRHGAGFWDRGIENGDELHDATKPYGSFGLEGFGDEIHSHN